MPSPFSSMRAGLGSDLRAVTRGLFRNPGFAWAAVLTLAVAIGGMTAMLTVANAVLFRPLPFPDAERLVSLCERNPQVAGFCVASTPNVIDWKRSSRSLSEIGVGRGWQMTLAQEGRNLSVRGGLATDGLFRALGSSPQLGRLFDPSDLKEGNRRVALLSQTLWQARFGGSPDIVGRSIRLEDSVYTVIGVLPAKFEVPQLEGIEVWTPLPFDPAAEDRRDWRGFQVYARLAPGVTLASARVELAAIQARLGELYPPSIGAGAWIFSRCVTRWSAKSVRRCSLFLAPRCWPCSSPASISPRCCWPAGTAEPGRSPFAPHSAADARPSCVCCCWRACCCPSPAPGSVSSSDHGSSAPSSRSPRRISPAWIKSRSNRGSSVWHS